LFLVLGDCFLMQGLGVMGHCVFIAVHSFPFESLLPLEVEIASWKCDRPIAEPVADLTVQFANLRIFIVSEADFLMCDLVPP
jgi:hypothetical protein